ncbi:UDP-N-acetylmuramoyl-tripeptide--D-alanyl-D-alanine ligase [Cyclobacterium lianum]|uniref:UDP-N-acetylmuramoyl-tripeptide--D-alanyl-D-alanine ligase n=1 Tax=Cyclobacterium lianum TaxID=388280 RepID=A0A1M7JJC0_9BACT|nr:UDP-N-acetylmuramoyl-tripeptide--D-alanyl-D-alanine ligase [Cyclobacterium lianum]SHM53056.1 UDP-N-acetylmuramoyl-tripeptide--D-alanyl-D-alanine ligase [Cyclobacterium lianum]
MEKIETLYDYFLSAGRVSTDTRKLQKGDLFFALKGPNFDGNQYASRALEQGASRVVVDDPDIVAGDRYALVNDALKALQDLATFHRKQFELPVIGLTGSNGKTTTKELIQRILSRKFKVHATAGNLNNHIGVPLTLLGITRDTEIAIIEMGANKQGDIAELSHIALPTHGLITNIGQAHLEGMGGPEGVLKTKTELFQFLRETGGQVFLNTNQPVFTNMKQRFETPVLFPGAGDFCPVTFLGADPFVIFSVEGVAGRHTSQLIGEYNFDNIAAAICVGKYFGVPLEAAARAAAAYTPSDMRSQIIEKRSNLIVLDAYNANPSSMEQALKAFDRLDKRKHKMVIVGDMLELGEHTISAHEKMGEQLQGMSLDKICLTGKLTQHALTKVPGALYFPDPLSFRNWLKDSALEEYQILIKGSRGMKLESLVDFI